MLRRLFRVFRQQQSIKYAGQQGHRSPVVSEDLATKPLSAQTTDLSYINGVPDVELETRTARIFKPSRSAMTSGIQKTQLWRLEFAPEQDEVWDNPLTVRQL